MATIDQLDTGHKVTWINSPVQGKVFTIAAFSGDHKKVYLEWEESIGKQYKMVPIEEVDPWL